MRAKNNASLWGDPSHYRVRIDTTIPSSPIISSSTHPDQDAWCSNNDTTFQWTTPSDISVVVGYSYDFDHSPSTTPDSIIDTTLTSKSYFNISDGEWWFHVDAKDNAGSWGSPSHYKVKVDVNAPSTPGTPDDGVPGWGNNSTPTFTWAASSDLGSGVKGYWWWVDAGSEIWNDNSTSVTVPVQSDGSHTFYVKAEDNIGNKGNSDSHGFQIDVVAPSTSSPDDGTSGWSNDNTPTFSWSCSDSLSGVAGSYWRVDDGSENWTAGLEPYSVTLPPQSEGNHTFYVKAKDNADNLGSWSSHSFQIDIYPPSITDIDQSNPNQQNPTGKHVPDDQAVTVSTNITDMSSGTKRAMLFYRTSLNNASWTNWIALNMTRSTGDRWSGAIRGFSPANVLYVQYKIVAYDNTNNTSEKPGGDYGYSYVVPEFSSLAMLLLTMLSFSLIIAVFKRNRSRGCKRNVSHFPT